MVEFQFAKKEAFLADNNIQFKDANKEEQIKEKIGKLEGNPMLILKCEKLNSPITVIDATPITESLLKSKLTI